MSLLVVGSVALDSIFTPFGETADALGGSAVYFSVAGVAAASGAGGRRGRERLSGGRARAARARGDRLVAAWSTPKARASAGRASTPTICRAGRRWRRGSACSPTSSPSCPPRSAPPSTSSSATSIPSSSSACSAQVERPALVVCDTMNYWIQSKKATLLELLGRVDVLMVNDGEARELSGDWNIHRAGRWILAQGPKRVVIKQGEYGALLIEPDAHLLRARPSRSRRSSIPPARATPSPAASWRYLARTGSVSTRTTSAGRWSYGAAMGSYAVEQFGIRGFEQVTLADVERRVAGLPGSHPRRARGAAADDASGSTPRPGSTSQSAETPRSGSAGWSRARGRRSRSGQVGAFGGMVRIPPGMRPPTLVLSTDGVGTKVLVALQAGRFDTVGEDLVNHSVNDILVHGALRSRSWTTSPGAGLGVEQIAGICGGHRPRVPGARDGAGRRRDGTDAGTLPAGHLRPRRARSSAWSRRTRRCTATRSSPGDVLLALRLDRTPYQRIHAGPPDRVRAMQARPRRLGWGTPASASPMRSWRCTGAILPACCPCSAGFTGSRTSPEAGSLATSCACSPRDARPSWTRRPGRCRRSSPRCSAAGRIATDEMRDVFNLGVGLIAVAATRAAAAAQAAAGSAWHGVAAWTSYGEIRPRPARGALRPSPSGGTSGRDQREQWPAHLAWRGWGRVQPNPHGRRRRARRRRVVGEGWHAEYGAQHAEPIALAAAGARARGATLVVDARALRAPGQAAALRRRDSPRRACGAVVAALARYQSGRRRRRRAASRGRSDVELGLERNEAEAQNAIFLHGLRDTARPFVALKLATRLDGRIADAEGHSRWISGAAARDYVHWLRAGFDAIAVGGRTARADDPTLTVRGAVHPRVPPGRIVFDRRRRPEAPSRWSAAPRNFPPSSSRPRRRRPPGSPRWSAPGCERVRAEPSEALGVLRAPGSSRLLVEGGGRLAGALLGAGWSTAIYWIQSPVWLGERGVPAMAGLPSDRSPRRAERWRGGATAGARARTPSSCWTGADVHRDRHRGG